MKDRSAVIWRRVPPDIEQQTRKAVNAALSMAAKPVRVFFRVDDVGVPGRSFGLLMDIFRRQRAPLCLAVVPAWLTRDRWRSLMAAAGGRSQQWCWHQHGWRHVNHEPGGKKQEFGPSRPTSAIQRDLAAGRNRLQALLGDMFDPVFTPPWNRCSRDTLAILDQLGYQAVSGSRGSLPAVPPGLLDASVSVDLHTRKDPSARDGWRQMRMSLESLPATGCCGIMIHHQRMNPAAFAYLEMLIAVMREKTGLEMVHFRDMLGAQVG